MIDETLQPVHPLPRSGLLRWEIGLALLIKILFLTGLWFFFFQAPVQPRPDIGEFFGLPTRAELPDARTAAIPPTIHIAADNPAAAVSQP